MSNSNATPPAPPGQLFIVAAPSGAGKTSLVNALVASDPQLVISVSYTTRAPRPGEIEGRHYHFTTTPRFEQMRANGEFLEHARVFDHLYGTHGGTTRDILARGRDVVLEIDWQGARQVRASYPRCHSIFILPPSLETLRARLGQRGQDSAAVIEARMAKAQAEISHCDEFQYVVVNDDFQAALRELTMVVEHCRNGTAAAAPKYHDLLVELLGNG